MRAVRKSGPGFDRRRIRQARFSENDPLSLLRVVQVSLRKLAGRELVMDHSASVLPD